MKAPDHIKNELNELNSQLPAGAGSSPFEVPQGYFEGLADTVMNRIKDNHTMSVAEELAGISPFLAQLPKTNPYTVPQGFFTGNIENLGAFTGTEDSLVLSFVEKEGPYQVPTGYFGTLPEQVMEKITREEVKVVPIFKRKWMRLAVAAMITGIITLSGISYFNRGTSVQVPGDAVAVEINKASTEELNAFITTTAADVSMADQQLASQNTTEVKQLLKDVSDKELEAFLDQVPTEDEVSDIN